MMRYLCPQGEIYTVLPPNGRCPTHGESLTVEDDGVQAVAESVVFEAEIIEPPAPASGPRALEAQRAPKRPVKTAAKKGAKAAVKKAVTKAPKKLVKTAAKKVTKTAPKKAVTKAPKKTVKKAAKKSTKKATKKAVKKAPKKKPKRR